MAERKKPAKTAAQKKREAEERRKARKCTLPEDPNYVPKEERVPRKKMGRPTTLTEAIVDEAQWYLDGGWRLVGDVFPSVVGLACELHVSPDTLYDWRKVSDHFSRILKEIVALQCRVLLNGGTAGKLNPAITKLVLGKHGYHEKVDSTHTSPDGSMSPGKVDEKVVDKLVNKILD